MISEYDIVVIGAGGAGLSAAFEASRSGKKVAILEKSGSPGGNTIISSGRINGAGTHIQRMHNIVDDCNSYLVDTMVSGNFKNNAALVYILAHNSAESLFWMETVGATFTKVRWGMPGLGNTAVASVHPESQDYEKCGVSAPRMHDFEPKLFVRSLSAEVNSLGTTLLTRTKAISISTYDPDKPPSIWTVTKDGKLVEFRPRAAVIIASGGFAANPDMLSLYHPTYRHLKTDNVASATGDGIVMAQAIGARVRDMNYVQNYTRCYYDSGRISREAGRATLLVNARGERFVDEGCRRDLQSDAILAQPGRFAWAIGDSRALGSAKLTQKAVSAQTARELSSKIGVPEDALASTIREFNRYCQNGKDPDYGSVCSALRAVEVNPLFAVKIAPSVHFTIGGVEIDSDARVLRQDGTPFARLFAAGEVVGGLHGANRMSGNALTEAIVFGRLAGERASRLVPCT